MNKITILLIAFIVIGVAFLSGCNEENNPISNKQDNDKNSIPDNATVLKNGGSIQQAIDSVSNNGTIYVKNGTYFENINITKPIKLIGEDKNTTIINGNGSGIVLNISADYVTISGFKITGGGSISTIQPNSGIKIGSNYTTILDCNISNNKNYGIYFDVYTKTSKNIIKNNIFFKNKYGIYGSYAKSNNISSNSFIYNTDYGIYFLTQSDINMISYNEFIENNYAIRIKGSFSNTIINNLIKDNKYGLYFCCGAENNKVYNNVFTNNTDWNAKDDIINIWDNGKTGNYWDDYNGSDTNSDGIGDTPYLINYKIKNDEKSDNFPLMKPNFDIT